MTLTGNLTRDPELRSTPGGMAVLKMGVAVNDRAKNQQTGEWEDRPNFIDVVMFGARAESVSRFLSKGSKVAIEGKLRWSSWETPQGDKRSKIEVVVDEIEFMSSRDGGARSSSGSESSSGAGGDTYSAPASSAPMDDSEIPF